MKHPQNNVAKHACGCCAFTGAAPWCIAPEFTDLHPKLFVELTSQGVLRSLPRLYLCQGGDLEGDIEPEMQGAATTYLNWKITNPINRYPLHPPSPLEIPKGPRLPCQVAAERAVHEALPNGSL